MLNTLLHLNEYWPLKAFFKSKENGGSKDIETELYKSLMCHINIKRMTCQKIYIQTRHTVTL